MSGGGKNKKGGGGGGGHGGGWVITFADLMSLLMALFVMIVSFSNQDEQKMHDATGSIKDAFGVQTVAVERPGGMIEKDGSPMRDYLRDTTSASPSDGVEFANKHNEEHQFQGPETDTNDFAHDDSHAPPGEFLTAAASIRQALQDLPEYTELSKQIVMEQTPEGLDISIVDQEGRAMFGRDSSEPSEPMRVLLGRIAPVLAESGAPIRLTGHTESNGSAAENGMAAWTLSTARALSSASILTQFGMPKDSLAEVVGVADTKPLFPDNPFMPGNRRIEITMIAQSPTLPGNVQP